MGDKILSLYDKAAKWFCTTLGESDRWAHLFIGVLICFFFCKLDTFLWHRTALVACAFAMLLNAWVMLIKELTDFFRGSKFDGGDFFAGIIGGVIGCVFFLL